MAMSSSSSPLAADSPHDIVAMPYSVMEAQLFFGNKENTLRRDHNTVLLYNTRTQRILAQFDLVPVVE